ncbi:MAG: hypothetical protein WB697_18560 [Stellaceae bacterium]
MPRYIIERQYLVPMFEHILVEAPSLEAACREAIDDLAQPWGDGAELCFDDARETTVTCAVELPDTLEPELRPGNGDDRDTLSSLLYCSELEQLPIPQECRHGGEAPEPGVGFV